MKKYIIGIINTTIVISTIIIVVLMLNKKTYTINFILDEDKIYERIIIEKGNTVNKPINSYLEEMTFVAWTEKNNQVCDFSKKINSDINLYPTWKDKECIGYVIIDDNIYNCYELTVYTQLLTKPEGWHEEWCDFFVNVNWGNIGGQR